LRFPAKALLIVAFSWAVIAAVGWEAWRDAASGARARRAGTAAAAVIAIVALGLGLFLWREAAAVGDVLLEPLFTRQPLGGFVRPIAVALWGSAAAAALLLVLARAQGRWAAAVAGIVVVGELVLVHRDLSPTSERDLYAYRPPALAALAGPSAPRVYGFDYFEAGEGSRYLGHEGYVMKVLREDRPPWAEAAALRTALYPSVLGEWGVETAYAQDALRLHPPALAALTALLRRAEETPLHTRLLQMASVTHVVALHARGLALLRPVARLPTLFVEDLHVFAVPDPLPRAYVVDGARVVPAAGAVRTLADPAFDPRREVVVEEGRSATAGPAFRATAVIRSRRADRVVIETTAGGAGHLVLTDAYDPGWRATVDGQPAPVLRANAAFRAVPIGAGPHVVELVYRPRSATIGLAVSMATLSLVLAGLRARRRTAPAAAA
jgi:hypothetical protein